MDVEASTRSKGVVLVIHCRQCRIDDTSQQSYRRKSMDVWANLFDCKYDRFVRRFDGTFHTGNTEFVYFSNNQTRIQATRSSDFLQSDNFLHSCHVPSRFRFG